MSEPRYTLEDFNAVPGYTITDNGNNDERDSWLPLNLAHLPDQPPVKPTMGGFGLVYPGRRHVFSGPQESAKTLAAYAIGLETVRTNRSIVLIDFEMGAYNARNRLRDLGATPDELAHVHYLEPDQPATADRIATLVALNPAIVVIDAAAGAYDLQGLDDNKRQDVEKFTRLYVKTFWQHKIATIVIDHVVKNAETRGKYAIGSERKTGGVDVHLGFDTAIPIKRGTAGLYKIITHKDRDGYLQRGRLADLHLTSDPITHRIEWEFRPVEHEPSDDPWMPTALMEKVSRLLALSEEPLSRNQVELSVKGNTKHVRTAVEQLIRLGYATETAGARRSRLLTHQRTFTVREWENQPDPTPLRPLRPTSSPLRPNEVIGTSTTSSPPFGDEVDVTAEQPRSLRPTFPDEVEPREPPPGDLHETAARNPLLEDMPL